MKRIRVHSVEQYVAEIGPLMKEGLPMYRADDVEHGLLGVGFTGAETEVLISIQEFKETGDLVKVFEPDDGEAGGGEAMNPGVPGGTGFAFGSARAGAFGGVGAVSGELLVGNRHEMVLSA